MKIIGEELECVTHFECLGTSTKEECCAETEITVRMRTGWRNVEEMIGSIVRRRMPAKLIRQVMFWGRNVGYNEETKGRRGLRRLL